MNKRSINLIQAINQLIDFQGVAVMAATSGPAGTTVELVLAALVVSHRGHGRFLLWSFPVSMGRQRL